MVKKPNEPETMEITSDDVETLQVDSTPALAEARLVKQPTSQVLARFLSTANEVTQEDPEATSLAIVERILNATTVDEVLTPNQVVHAREIIGVPLNVTGIRWMESDFDAGPGMYAIMEAQRMDNDARVVVSCGGMNVLAQLWKLNDLDAFPARITIQQAPRPTKAGFLPLWLEAGPVPFE